MGISNELARQFAKQTVDKRKNDTGKTVTGTAVKYNGSMYVQIDGSDQLTPIISSTVGMKDGDRVTVLIKDHTTTVTGNTSSPSVSQDDIDGSNQEIIDQITEFEIIVAEKASIKDLEVEKARIDDLVADNVTIKDTLTASKAEIDQLKAKDVEITGSLTAQNAEIENLKATKLDVDIADIKYATVENLEATNADIHNLKADYGEFKQLSTDKFAANEASIKKLETEKLSATEADLKYANIDFANIGKAAIENFFSKSGMIGDLVVGEGTITGTLVGVTIKGDLIEGGTVKADKLVVQGEDGLYYKLNVSAEKVSAQQTEYNSLNGSIITAKSITAEKVNVNDLVAFGATIGGFHITDSAIYSGVKESIDNTTRGTYMDDDGQFAIGDGSNYLKFFRDSNGKYKLDISASSIRFGTSGETVENVVQDMVVKTETEYYVSTSPTSLVGGSWSLTSPTWSAGKYIWTRTKSTKKSGKVEYSNPACTTGAPGKDGVGTPGTPGKDGKTSYLHIAYANSADGTDGFSVSDSNGKLYIGQYTDFTEADSIDPKKYSWSKIKGTDGAAGVGIKSSTVTYQASTSGTTIPTGSWVSTIPNVADGQYLWTRTVITYTDGKTTTSYSVGKMGQNGSNGAPGKPGTDGKPGADGVGIKSTSVKYQAGSSQTTAPTGAWLDAVPKLSAATPYLWTKTVITYTDGKTSTSYSVSSTLDGVEVGGRNLVIGTNKGATNWDVGYGNGAAAETSKVFTDLQNVEGVRIDITTPSTNWMFFQYASNNLRSIFASSKDELYTISFDIKSDLAYDLAVKYKNGDGTSTQISFGKVVIPAADTWTHIEHTGRAYGVASAEQVIFFDIYSAVVKGARYFEIANLKLEKGNKATDWTPAPEDIQQDIDDAQNSANDANNKVDNITDTVTKTSAELKVLNDSISSLVTDARGQSLMTQTGSGWTFNIGSIQSALNGAIGDIQDVKGDINGVTDLANKTNQLANDVAKKTAYINMTQDESGQPVMELGQQNGEFKLRITNTSMDFMQGSQKIAYLSNRQLYIQSSVVTDEMKIGATSGYIWKKRANGNMGLRYVSG